MLWERIRTHAGDRVTCLAADSRRSAHGIRRSPGRIDDGFDLGDGIGWEAALLGVIADRVFVFGVVNADDPIVDDIALDPVDAHWHVIDDLARFGRGTLKVRLGHAPGTGDVAFNKIPGHW